jgi:hypothetical protein
VLRRSLCKPSLCKPSFGGTASDHDATRLAIWAPPAASAALLQADGKCHKCLGTLVISAPSTWSSSLSPHFPASGEATTLVSPTEADVRGFGTCLVRFRGGGGWRRRHCSPNCIGRKSPYSCFSLRKDAKTQYCMQ